MPSDPPSCRASRAIAYFCTPVAVTLGSSLTTPCYCNMLDLPLCMAKLMPLPQSKKTVRSVLPILLPSPVVLSAFLGWATGPDIFLWLNLSGGHFVFHKRNGILMTFYILRVSSTTL